MPVEIYNAGAGFNLTAPQSVQTQNMVDVTLAGNSTSAGAGYILISSGTMTLAGGNNITLSQNGKHVSILGAAAGTGAGIMGFSAGSQLATSGTLSFADGNGISFGLAGSETLTASYTVPAPVSFGVSTGGNTLGTTGTVSNQILFVGGTNVTLSQSSAAGGATITFIGPAPGTTQSAQTGISGIAGSAASTVTNGTVQFGNLNGVSFGLNGSTMTASYTQSVPPRVSSFYWEPQGAITSLQQANGSASYRYVEIPYDITFTRVDVPILMSLASSATTNTGNIEITSGLCIYTLGGGTILNPITGSLGTTTLTWASNSANFSNLTGGRFASFALASSLSAGFYYVGFQLSTTNNSSIGLSTTQLGNTISMLLGANYTASAVDDFGVAINATRDVINGMGVEGGTFSASNHSIALAVIVANGAAKQQANYHVFFRS